MNVRFPGAARRRFPGGRQLLNLALGMTALLMSPPGLAYAELVMNRQSQGNAVSIETHVFGPVQVQLKNSKSGDLLFESTLDGPGVFEVADLPPLSLNNLVLHAVPGKPATAAAFTYGMPFSPHADWTISQGYQGKASHGGALNEYAVDFDIPLGTPVLAARTGVVMEVIDGFPDDGRTRASDLAQANIIRILHEDGSMSLYGHLLQDSAVVSPGQWLVGGTVIAQSGNSGYSHGPHLHFAVQLNAGMQLRSIPFRMQSVNGIVSFSP